MFENEGIADPVFRDVEGLEDLDSSMVESSASGGRRHHGTAHSSTHSSILLSLNSAARERPAERRSFWTFCLPAHLFTC